MQFETSVHNKTLWHVATNTKKTSLYVSELTILQAYNLIHGHRPQFSLPSYKWYSKKAKISTSYATNTRIWYYAWHITNSVQNQTAVLWRTIQPRQNGKQTLSPQSYMSCQPTYFNKISTFKLNSLETMESIWDLYFFITKFYSIMKVYRWTSQQSQI